MTDQERTDLLTVAQEALDAGFTVDELCKTISNLKFRKVIFCSVFVTALRKALAQSNLKNSDIIFIKDLDLDTKEYARFNDLVRFGFCYKPDGAKSGQYVLESIKTKQFLDGQLDVPEHYYVNPIDKTFTLSDKRVTVNQVMTVKKAQKLYGPKMTTYSRSAP